MKEKDNTIDIDLMSIFQVLKSHIAVILIVTAIFGAIGFGYSKFVITPEYRASATMIVNNSNNTTGTISNSDLNASATLANTYSIIIKSHAVIDSVLDRLQLNISSAKVISEISVSAVDDTQIIKISMRDANPELAKQIIQAITVVAPDIITEKVEASSCKVIDEAIVTSSPVYPSVKKYTAMGALIGFICIVGFFTMREMLDTTIRSEDQLTELTGLPNLGIIPKI